MTITDTLPSTFLVHLADALSVQDGGFSIVVPRWEDARAGFAVSAFPALEQQLAGAVSYEDLERYIVDHAALLTDPRVVFGGWRNPDNGVVSLDVSVIVPSLRHAVALAREHNQLAIWDFAHGESVPIIGDGRDSR